MQDASEHSLQCRHKRTTYAADASWSHPEVKVECVSLDPADAADELASDEELDAAALEKTIYDDWDDDSIAL